MDNICVAVLNRISSLGSGYKIVSEDELLESFPEGEEKSSSALARAVKKLCAEGYVDVKYSDGNMFCVNALKSYVPPVAEKEEPIEYEQTEDDGFDDFYAEKPNFLPTFLAAFAGGAAGSLLISLIFALLV